MKPNRLERCPKCKDIGKRSHEDTLEIKCQNDDCRVLTFVEDSL